MNSASTHWPLLPFGSILSEHTRNGVYKAAEYHGSGVPIVNMGELFAYPQLRSVEMRRVVVTSEELERFGLQEGDLLFARRSIVAEGAGKCCVVVQLDEPTIFESSIIRARPDTYKVLSKFLFHYFQSQTGTKEMLSIVRSVTISGISGEDLLKIMVPVPPLAEQARIVQVLDDADAVVRALDALIDAKLRHKHAQAERLLSGLCRFPEFKGQAWQTYTLGELFTERVECNRPDLELLAVTGTEGIVKRDSLVKRDTSSEDKSKYLRVASGDIAYNTMRMWQGVFGLSRHEGIVSPAYTVCVPTALIDGLFTSYLFKTPAIIARFRRYSQGLVDDTLNLKFPAFAKVQVTIPGLPEQRRIADMLELLDKEIELLRGQHTRQKQIKHGLMQSLLLGHARVREFAP